MGRYRKLPVEIDAIQWNGRNLRECVDFLGADFAANVQNGAASHDLRIYTLEGVMECPMGHWTIQGVKGEHYSCDPEVFAATYEPVEAAS